MEGVDAGDSHGLEDWGLCPHTLVWKGGAAHPLSVWAQMVSFSTAVVRTRDTSVLCWESQRSPEFMFNSREKEDHPQDAQDRLFPPPEVTRISGTA